MGRNFNLYPITGPKPNKIHLRGRRRVRQNLPLIGEPQPPCELRKLFHYFSLEGHTYGRVKTQGPFSVTATTCSK